MFHLKQKDIDYINEKGCNVIRQHARDFIAKREADVIMTWIQREMERQEDKI